jgi:hypothetical protein
VKVNNWTLMGINEAEDETILVKDTVIGAA